jgi:hypothetical protein
MDSEKSSVRLHVMIAIDWRFVAAMGTVLLARLLIK